MHRADAQPRQAARHACGRSRACCRAPQLMPALTHTHSVGVAESGWRLATAARRCGRHERPLHAGRRRPKRKGNETERRIASTAERRGWPWV